MRLVKITLLLAACAASAACAPVRAVGNVAVGAGQLTLGAVDAVL